ncbi:anti-sigma factor [Pedobacter sp. HMWF019]|uniref:FecR family protein n=1 Tax=Pedobacter sp. HMWF019 TaxID=2056856 RepID=UPI000D3A34FD|nr:FecR family protein [Pedobacter sp. HMWF019]PTT03766.1 anti-sigma factor [Pedobacter sp. HMWF019]
MTKEEYLLLYEKFLSGTSSPEEEADIKAYQDEFELIDGPWNAEMMGAQVEMRDQIRQKLLNNIRVHKSHQIGLVKRWLTAAVLLLCVSAGLIFLSRSTNSSQQGLAHHHLKSGNSVVPGGNKAVLTLADGSVVALDSSSISKTIKQGNTSILNESKGLLVYAANGPSGSAPLFNKIAVPRGGQYQLKLPDGTVVWLNSASSLRFPTQFSGKERSVELNGEAYFEVAKNKEMPFKVHVRDMEVRVLGTHFNIMAYDDEESINTTLLEGSVKVSNALQTATIRPGQQASLKKSSGMLGVEDVNIAEAIAWKNGKFLFADEDIETIMRRISRWYDVDVEYKGNLSDKNFAGSISRYEDVSEVLKMLELTGTIHFKIEGRRIIVMP